MPKTDISHLVEAVRRFNRFYTRQIGVLNEGLVKSSFSLTEARVIYELAHRGRSTAAELGAELELDAGYLSRILRGFDGRGLILKEQSETDGRQSHISLTESGRDAFAMLNARSHMHMEMKLGVLSGDDRQRLVEMMQAIEELLGSQPEKKGPYLLRSHQPGDIGWVVHRHGVLYADEYGWDERFEALVAGVVADFIRNYDPKRNRCWIAEKEGEIIGSIFLMRESDEVAKLRLLLVEPKARGLGLGGRLVDECIRFARGAGYRTITLWTNNVLNTARHIYEQRGFRKVHEEPHQLFGHGLVGETWELVLQPVPTA